MVSSAASSKLTIRDIDLSSSSPKGKEDVEGYENKQVQRFDCVGITLIDMVCVPTIDQFVESIVFDVPPLTWDSCTNGNAKTVSSAVGIVIGVEI